MALLYGRAVRVTAQNGGFRPGQVPTLEPPYHGVAQKALGNANWLARGQGAPPPPHIFTTLYE